MLHIGVRFQLIMMHALEERGDRASSWWDYLCVACIRDEVVDAAGSIQAIAHAESDIIYTYIYIYIFLSPRNGCKCVVYCMYQGCGD